MMDNLWKCFETTGNIQTYLGFKDYERLKNQQVGVEGMNQSLEVDVIDEANRT